MWFHWNPAYGEFWPKFGLFWTLKLFLKKKNLQNHLKPPWLKGGFKILNLKPPWNHRGFTKKDDFPKSALKSYFDESKISIIFKIPIQIFLKIFEKNLRSKFFFQKFTKKSYGWSNYIKKMTIFCVLKSKSGPFLEFWKTPWDIAQFLICNFV